MPLRARPRDTHPFGISDRFIMPCCLGINFVLFAIFIYVLLLCNAGHCSDGHGSQWVPPPNGQAPLNPIDADLFQYDDLFDDQKTRLVCLHPGEYNDQLEGDLVPIGRPMVAHQNFRALSYTWGHEMSESTILLHAMGSKSGHYQLQKNLELSLRQDRDTKEIRCSWVDALSINQSNSTEKAQQIPGMLENYMSAYQTLIILGFKGHAKDRPIDDLKSLARHGFDSGRCRTAGIDHVQMLTLLGAAWLQRKWVVQEAIGARQATIIYGNDEIDLQVFCNGMRELQKCKSRIYGDPVPKNAFAMIDLFCELRGHGKKLSLSIYELLHRTRQLIATDPRDILYSLEGLAWDVQKISGLTTNYSRSVAETYREYAQWDIMLNGPQVFALLSDPKFIHDLPSWTPDLRQIATIAEPLSEAKNRSMFDASGGIWRMGKASFSIQDGVEVYHTLGQKVDTILHLSQDPVIISLVTYDDPSEEAAETAQGMRRWLEGCISLAKDTGREWTIEKAQAFAHTLTCNMNGTAEHIQDKAANSLYSYIEYLAWLQYDYKAPAAPRDLEAFQELESGLSRWTTNRRFGVTREGRFIMVPLWAQPGDEVAILWSSKVPVIVRASGHGRYTIVGESYVDGVMNGEMLDLGSPKDIHFS